MQASVTGGLDGLAADVAAQVALKWAAITKVSLEGAEFGAKTAQSYTASRPGATTGKAGRIDTGAMVEAIRSKPVSAGPDLIEVQYGFVREFEEYMRLQTVTGFAHNRSGDMIEPTFALRDSIEPTRAFTRALVERVI